MMNWECRVLRGAHSERLTRVIGLDVEPSPGGVQPVRHHQRRRFAGRNVEGRLRYRVSGGLDEVERGLVSPAPDGAPRDRFPTSREQRVSIF